MIIKSRFIFAVLYSLVSVLFSSPLYAKEYYLEQWQCFVDLPQGVTPLEVTDTKATFSNDEENVFFQIKVYPGKEYESAEIMYSDITKKLNAEGDGIPFNYNGKDAVFASSNFNTDAASYRGYSVLINGEKQDFAVLSFCETEIYDMANYVILSALDSFSDSVSALYTAGPVSSFYETSSADTSTIKISFPFEKKRVTFKKPSRSIETSDTTADREARVLYRFTALDTDAWSRVYRMIYRDNYSKMDSLFYYARDNLFKGIHDPVEISERLLTWIHGFSYSRTGTIAVFSPPLKVLNEYSGDCDSLGLLYIILLKRFGIDAVLMVSAEYSHSMAAVDIPGKGARFPFKGKAYLVAEMTKDVKLGQINASTADPSKWMGITFYWNN